ncbi:hypothetical protein LTR37_021104 [Vermiconidia calcicola]|uniref:Uncharacterized protein n=1 Tax=Vermiconidia calcicola TaxID=1690605 RepID=A0ACC3M9C2_9PEZI|nr:hypothetical protein LTR37_021104 [Vermiconidia calcicola]
MLPTLWKSFASEVFTFLTTAGATGPEEVPDNPLPDQVNPLGWDSEETDSDLDSDDNQEEAVRCDEDNSSSLGQGVSADQDYQPEDKRQSTRNGRGRAAKAVALRSGRSGLHTELSSAIGVEAQLPGCQIGAVELLTFFPNHTQWPEAGLRLYRNGWKTLDIAKLQLHARNRLTRQGCDKRVAALRHQVLKNGQIFFNDEFFNQTSHAHLMTTVTSYDASNYAPRSTIASSLAPNKLIDIANGVVNWPTGEDRGLVTQAIEFTSENALIQYTTLDIPWLSFQHTFSSPNESLTTTWDHATLQRARQTIEQAGTYR